MSRSYRKPWVVDGYDTKRKQWAKRQANKRIRQTSVVADGMQYKKLYCRWDISDYRYYADNKPYQSTFLGILEWQHPFPEMWKYNRK